MEEKHRRARKKVQPTDRLRFEEDVEKYRITPGSSFRGRKAEPGIQSINLSAYRYAGEWIPAIHSTGVEPCGNDEMVELCDFFNDLFGRYE